jgi:hypothetical protein
MGILVPEATLPMGLVLSNVYVTFGGETIYVNPKNQLDMYRVSSTYRVYKDPSKEGGTNITVPISVSVADIARDSIFGILYEELKIIYPGSVDC